MAENDELTIEQLEKALKIHKKEYNHISRMTDGQFVAFKSNFSVGGLEISRGEALALLSDMIAMNLNLQRLAKSGIRI